MAEIRGMARKVLFTQWGAGYGVKANWLGRPVNKLGDFAKDHRITANAAKYGIPLASLGGAGFIHNLIKASPSINIFPNDADVWAGLAIVITVATTMAIGSVQKLSLAAAHVADPAKELKDLRAQVRDLTGRNDKLTQDAGDVSRELGQLRVLKNDTHPRVVQEAQDLRRDLDAADLELAHLRLIVHGGNGQSQIPSTGHAELDALLTAISDTAMRDNIAQMAKDKNWFDLSNFLAANDLTKVGIDRAIQDAAVSKVMDLYTS